MAVAPQKPFVSVDSPGMGGWNAFDKPTAVKDNELVDVQNMVYDKGILCPREGSELLYDKPSTESGDSLQLITATTSDGIDYLIAIYANHFYLRHPTTSEWIRINQAYAPVETTIPYGHVNWNNGRGDDRLYVCNGVDDFIRWDMCVSTVNGSHAAGVASVTLVDGSRFPATGTLILKSSGGTLFTEAYTSRAGNVFTLTNTLDNNVDSGSYAVIDVVRKASMEVGKYINKHQQRLVVANYYGGETVFFYSKQADPEDFTVASTIVGGGTETIADGNGEITGLHDFGQFLLVEKSDSLHSFSFEISADLGSKLARIQPVLSGQALGPLSMNSSAKISNDLMYPTKTNGFVSISPSTTGSNVSVSVNPISRNINPYLKSFVDLTSAATRIVSNENKVYWAVTLVGATLNTLVIEYDILRKTWTRHVGWAVKDFTVVDEEILYLDVTNGGIYKINNGTYNDAGNDYQSYGSFKCLHYGEIGRTKTQNVLYVEGLMTPAAQFFIDVYFNENGQLDKQTYQIDVDTENLLFSDPITDSMGSFILGNPILGMVSLANIGDLSAFRGYLALPSKNGFFNIQARVYGSRGAFWAIGGFSMEPEILPPVPKNMLIAPI